MKLWTDKNYPIIISCAKELSRWTDIEVRDLGYSPIEVTENTVVVRGDMRDVMKLNLKLRTAHRVLVPLLRAECRNIRDLYELARSILLSKDALGQHVAGLGQLRGDIRGLDTQPTRTLHQTPSGVARQMVPLPLHT